MAFKYLPVLLYGGSGGVSELLLFGSECLTKDSDDLPWGSLGYAEDKYLHTSGHRPS